MGITLPHGAPEFRQISLDMLRLACRRAASDMRRAPLFGLFFAGFYVLLGWILVRISLETGQSYWLVLAVGGFPIIAPFAAVGLYEVSRRLAADEPLSWRDILGVILHQHTRQLPSLSAVLIVILLFWFFLGHMIFALFLGLSTMTNISSSLEVYLSINGFMMLAIGSTVGALFAMLVYMITLFSVPMLVAREVDFVTAMIASFQAVQNNFFKLMIWALIIAGFTFLSMLPWFLGLFLTLPLFGHAAWHLYELATEDGQM